MSQYLLIEVKLKNSILIVNKDLCPNEEMKQGGIFYRTIALIHWDLQGQCMCVKKIP